MKSILSKCITKALVVLLILSACTGSPPASPDPTQTGIPTNSVPATATPPPAPTLLGGYELLTPEDMRFDFEEFFHRLEATHPNPYSKRPKADVDLERQRIYEELGQPMTMIEFYKKVAPLVNSLGDFHTEVYLPEEVFEALDQKELFFPFIVAVEEDHAYIVSNFSNNSGIEIDSELLEVNGTSISTLREQANRYFPMEGSIHPFVFLFLFGSTPEYQMDVILPGSTAPVRFTIPGMASDQIRQKESASSTPAAQFSEPVTYQTLPDAKIGLLAVNRFWGIGPLLKSAFVQIQQDGIEHLILDVRSNSGGKYDDVDALMDYLTDQPYRWCSRNVEAPFEGYGSGDSREVECETIQPFDTVERFEGRLYLLIGPDTFSAAITFATILQDYGLATLIGEETTDAASYCANAHGSALPRTGLLNLISETCYIRPSGVQDDLPVIPDIFVDTTVDDQLSGQDPVLHTALEMIRHSPPTP